MLCISYMSSLTRTQYTWPRSSRGPRRPAGSSSWVRLSLAWILTWAGGAGGLLSESRIKFVGYPPLRKISPAGLVVPLTRPAGAAAFNDKNLGYLKYLKSVPYTDAFNDAKTWTKNYILQPLEAAGLSEPYQARGSCWPAKCRIEQLTFTFTDW